MSATLEGIADLELITVAEVGSGAIDDELAALGFPFDGDVRARALWASEVLAQGLVERTSQIEQMRRGVSLGEIARNTGCSVERVKHHLRRAPGWQTDPRDEWRLVESPETIED